MLGLGGYGAGVAQDAHHLEEEEEEGGGEARGQRMLEIWKIEDQSADRAEEKHFSPCKYAATPVCHGTDANRNTPF